LRSLKEKGWKPVQMMLSKFASFTDVCMAWWLNSCHSAAQMAVNLTFSKTYISFNFLYSPLIYAIFTKCASLFQFFPFFVCQALTMKFLIIYENAAINDCRHKQKSAYRLTVLSLSKCTSKSHQARGG